MAAFTSSQSGNWNDGATWGNASPGVKGTDWPGAAGDTFTVAVGHTVSYNVSEANELGQGDLAGKLSFDDAANRLLTFGHQNLNIANGGELEIGTSGANFDGAYTAEVLWNTTSDTAKGLIIADGGKLTVYGDSAYCTAYEDTLANDAENTDGDVYIKTVNDMSADWHIGDELTIKVENAGDSSSHTDAIKLGTIVGFAGTVIELNIAITAAAGVGNTWTAPVRNVTRNVRFGKVGASTAIANYNTNRPKFTDANAVGNANCTFSHAMATGFYSLDSDFDFQFINSTLRNGYFGIYYGSGHTISGNVYSNYFGIHYGSGHTFSGDVYSNYYGAYFGSGHTFSGNLYSNSYGAYFGSGHTFSGNLYSNSYGTCLGSGHTISGNVYSNSYGTYLGSGHTFTGRIGYDGTNTSAPNTIRDIDSTFAATLLNAKLPLAGLNVRRNQPSVTSRVFCEHHDRVVDSHKIYDNNGDVVKVLCDGSGDRPSVDPDGNQGACIELSNVQSICDANNPLRAWMDHQFRIWAPASSSRTYTFPVQTTYAGISAGGLELAAEYLDEGSGGHLGEETHAPAISQRADATDWSESLVVTVTPAQEGWITFQIRLMEYEAGNEVWIWPEVGVS